MSKPYYLVVRGVLTDNQNRVLMLQRSKSSKTHPLCWEFPGGKSADHENFAEALIREFKEETGLLIEIGPLLGSSEYNYGDYQMVYLIFSVINPQGYFVIGEEHDNFAWIKKEELKTLEVSPQLRTVRDIISNVTM